MPRKRPGARDGERFNEVRIEGHESARAAVGAKIGRRPPCEIGAAVPPTLELDYETYPAIYLLKKLREGLDTVGALPDAHPFQLGDCLAQQRTRGRGKPVEVIVMKNDNPAVPGKLQIALDCIVEGHGSSECSGRILDHAGSSIVQSAMGNRNSGEP